ncbi:hypothetical protein ACIQF6_15655 [Kitasatospora sp. NPDC092948]|uniref:hypothetical protein n=1 Tax=Kitasatospora sp. NPDC092948 TaxID=3364088 RepID=UPI00380C08EE
MHIPAYAHATVRAALPALPTSRQMDGRDCCACGSPFGEELGAIPLGPTPTTGLFACRPCLERLVTRARQTRDTALTEGAEQARADLAAWEPIREHYLARLDGVQEAADAVAGLAQDEGTRPHQVAWLLVSLESAWNWLPDAPQPPASIDPEDPELKASEVRLNLSMIAAREAVAERLAYHVINQAQPAEPEMCEELECPEGCSGRHDWSDVDCGPDAIFENLADHGIAIEEPPPAPPSPRLAALFTPPSPEPPSRLPDIEEQASAVLTHLGIDLDDTEVLLSAAAVGLVHEAWRAGPLDAIHAAPGGPNDGEVFAQSVDLYRRARKALLAARDGGPEKLAAFTAVAVDLSLPWAGGSTFTLRAVPEPEADPNSEESVTEFVQYLDNRVWFTAELMRERGWRAALLHRAISGAFMASRHFGMPDWPKVVATAMQRLAALDRSDAPAALADLDKVESAMLQAPDRLGVEALEWISRRGLLA